MSANATASRSQATLCTTGTARQARPAPAPIYGRPPSTAMIPSPVNSPTVPSEHCTTTAARSTSAAMISRNCSAPTTEAMSIEWTTSANRTVTCLYSAWASLSSTGEPQLWQTGRSPRAWCHTSATNQRTLSCPDLLPAIATAARPTPSINGNLDADLVSGRSNPVTCSDIGGAKGTRTPDLLDAHENHSAFVVSSCNGCATNTQVKAVGCDDRADRQISCCVPLRTGGRLRTRPANGSLGVGVSGPVSNVE